LGQELEIVSFSVETSWSDVNALPYHLKQWTQTKESTIAFIDFISPKVKEGGHFLDLGSGGGAATYQLSQINQDSFWTGIDLDLNLINIANDLAQQKGIQNLFFYQGDLTCFSGQSQFDGVVSLQTMSWLNDYRPAFSNVFRNLQPEWFAVTSLFFEGDISAYTNIVEHKTNRLVHYNTYSIPEVTRFSKQFGYELSRKQCFELPIDLPKPIDQDVMGTYSIKLDISENPSRLQISGPLLMNWYMLLFQKSIEL